MYSYSGFDVRVLKHALTRHKLDVDFFLNRNHYDLCELIKQNYVLPVTGYGVKEVGDFFGYKYKKEINGLYAASVYMSREGTKEKLPKDIFHYIQ
ncbi:MAG: ribonuclease H-like domain-containing protein, partial [Crocinitomicaceae bacterium]